MDAKISGDAARSKVETTSGWGGRGHPTTREAGGEEGAGDGGRTPANRRRDRQP